METEEYAIYLDDSGSVSGSKNYWDTVQDILDEYGKDIKHFYRWNSRVYPSSKKEFEKWIAGKIGSGGNETHEVASDIVKNQYRNIILITDGQVTDSDVQKCDKVFDQAKQKGFKIKKSLCYLVCSYNTVLNMSVSCPFTRYCENKVFTKKQNVPLQQEVSFTQEDYLVLDTLEEISLENFEAKYELIEGLIIALNMGKSGNIPLKNQLVTMKNRLVKELSKKMGKKDTSLQLREHLENKDFESAIKISQEITNAYFSNLMGSDLEVKISHLINLCGDLTGKYNLGQIKSNKMATAKSAVEGQLDKGLEVQDLSKNPIECPIIMDEDVPQILIDECEPLFLNVEKGIIDDISACPLRLLNYPDIKAKFKARISNFTGVKYADKLKKNPFTQSRLLGAIPLGSHHTHVTVGNYTLAKLISGGKILGNLNLYYAVLWHIIEEGEIEYLKDIKANVSQHLIYRLKTSTTMASLCGLAQFVTTQLSTDVAIWYCVNSGYLNLPAEKDTFRFHVFNMEPMIKITNLLGYPIHENLKNHLNRTVVMMNLLSRFKKMSTKEKKDFKALLHGLHQNGVFIDNANISKKIKDTEVCVQFVPIDGSASENQIIKIRERLPKICSNLNNEELYYISTLIDAQKSASDIILDYNLKISELPKGEINWCYGLSEQFSDLPAQINPKTFRPFYRINGDLWSDLAKKTYKIEDVNQLFKHFKYFEEFVNKYEKKPEFEELLVFYYNRYVVAEKCSTLPFLIEKWTHDVIKKYEAVFPEGYDIKSIIKKLEETRTIIKRQEIEKN